MHALGKLLSLRKVGQLALHPYHVAVRGISHGSVDRALAATLVSVVALSGPRGLPVKMHIHTNQALGDGSGLGIALAL